MSKPQIEPPVPPPSRPPHDPDARIDRGLRISAGLLVLIVVIAAGVLWVASRPEQLAPANPPDIPNPPAPPTPTAGVPEVRFTDITAEAGIGFVHVNGATGDKLLPETMGAGVAFLDYDRDGHQDLLFINSDWWPGQRPDDAPPATMALYRNDGAGRFDDATASAGLDVSMYGMGVAVGDYTNNGYPDVFITAVGPNRLFQNNGDGTFTDATEAAGVAGGPDDWSTSAAFFDSNNNGLLDLFVCNYVVWSPEINAAIDYRLTGLGRAYGPPMDFEGTFNTLYRNNGDGTFTDASGEAGLLIDNPVTGGGAGKALAVAIVDWDGDGHLDVVVANDTVRNFLLHNQGDGTFVERGTELGVAYDRGGDSTGAMGIDAGHFRNDEALGIFIGNFAHEMSSVYVSRRPGGYFTDDTVIEGIGGPTRLALTFGAFLFDADLDGRLDFLQANGHVEDQINIVQPAQHYKQSAQLFWNAGGEDGRTFRKVPHELTGDLPTPIVGRGAAYADINGNGRLDVALAQIGGPPLLLRNDADLGHNYVRCRLVGTRDNRDAIGARVELTAGGVTQRRQVMPTRSYLSQVELPVTFGLGPEDRAESLRVTWPDGSVQEVPDPPINREIEIVQE